MPRTLAQNASYIKDTIKPAIKSAIEAQGVTVPSTDSFLDYADRIGEIEGGGSGYQLKDLPTGSISTVNDAAELPLNALKVSVEAWQEGSGDPSPSNVRPIHGWSTATITTDAGANLLGDANNWNINASGSIVSSGSYSTYTAQVEQGCSYKLTQTGTGNIVYAFYSNNPAIGSSSYNSSRTVVESANTAVITAPISGYVAIRTDKNTVSNQALKRANVYTHAFTDAQGNPLTVYGAEWDVANGGMKATNYFATLNGDEGFTLVEASVTNPRRFMRTLSKMGFPYGVDSQIISNRFILEPTASPNNKFGTMRLVNNILVFPDSEGVIATASDFNQWLADNNTQICYKLATPTTTQLSPLSIRLLEGTNNLYADCGEVIEGEYFSGSAKGYVDGIKYAGEGDGGIASYTNVKSADELLGASAITFEVYARIDSYVNKTSGAYARIMEFGNSQQTGRLGFIGLASDNDNNLCYWDDTADIASGIDIWTLGDIHLISVVKTTSGVLKIYVDGVLKYTGSSTLTITSSIIDYVTERGGYSSQVDSARQLNGEVFAWRVYAKELSAANIAQNLTADRSLYSR